MSSRFRPQAEAALQQTNASYVWTGQPTSTKSYTHDGLNRDAAIAALAGGFDARGNLTADGQRTFTYDVENRLTSSSGGGASMTLSYDPLGRLFQTVSAGATTQFLYDGTRLVGEYDGSAASPLRRYVHGGGVDEPLVWYEGSGTADRRWLHADRQGSTIAVTNGAGAATIYTYGPYGEPQDWQGSRFRYTGQIALPEAQLYHYKARVYDPVMGRFLQTDPIGQEDDPNLYGYVKGNSINAADPSGECSTGTRLEEAKNDGCKIAYSDNDHRPGAPTTSGQRQALARGDADGYWRQANGDPIKEVGQTMDPENGDASISQVAKTRLLGALMSKYGVVRGYNEHGVQIPDRGDVAAVYREYNVIRLEVARANMAAVDSDRVGVPHLLSARQIAAYHWKIFEAHGLPRTVFGGTPFTGTYRDLAVTRGIWCGTCDVR